MKRITFGLLALLLAVLVWLKPVNCEGRWPVQLISLWGYLHWQGLAGAQLAGRDKQGHLYHCQLGRRADGELITAADTFYYASLSKMFLIWLALELEAEEKIKLHSYVLDYVAVAAVQDQRWRDMTLKHLLTHHAGFDRNLAPDPMFAKQPWCPNRLAEGIASTELNHAPGQTYRYANVGYCLLAEILAQQQGVSVEQLFRNRFNLVDGLAIAVVPDGAVILQNSQLVISDIDRRWLPIYRAHPAVGAWQGSATQWRDIWLAQLDRKDMVAEKIKQQLFDGECEGDVGAWRSCNQLGFYRYRPSAASEPMLWRDGSLPGSSSFVGFNKQGSFVVLLLNQRKEDWMSVNNWLGKWVYELAR